MANTEEGGRMATWEEVRRGNIAGRREPRHAPNRMHGGDAPCAAANGRFRDGTGYAADQYIIRPRRFPLLRRGITIEDALASAVMVAGTVLLYLTVAYGSWIDVLGW